MASNRRNLSILFFTLVVVMLGFGIIIPILPFYVESFGAGGRELGMLMAIYATMQFIFAPIWGQMSDRRGRKPILLIGILGNAVTQLLMGLSTSYWMLFGSRALAGILSSATLPTAMAYIGDSTSEEERGGGMGLLGAAMGVGMVLGPGLGGLLAGRSLSLPFFLAAILSLLALVLVWAILPESLPKEHRAEAHMQPGFVDQMKQLWTAMTGPLGFLLFLSFLMNFGLTAFEGIFGLYCLTRFNYDAMQVGAILAVIGLVSAVVQGVMTGPLTRRWGEVALIKVSLLGSAAGFLIMLGAFNFVTVVASTTLFMVFNSLLRPGTSSLISKRATGGQGVAMGLNNASMSLGRIVGPLWAGLLFDVRIIYPYLSSAVIMLGSWILSLIWLPSDRQPVPAEAAGAES